MMGAPKQKWTSEEEGALKAGVLKHGAGKWRTILKDPEFSSILYLRSNVDLKDKWRNLSVMASGWGSRERARVAMKRGEQEPKKDENPLTLSTIAEDSADELVDVKPLAIESEPLQITNLKRSMPRLDSLIMEAITALMEPSGSSKNAITAYIEDQYWPPPDFQRSLSEKLRLMAESGRLVKVNHKYKVATRSSSSARSPEVVITEGKQKELLQQERNELKVLTKSQIDAELSCMRNMSAQEAAAAAAQAVAEAEAAMLEAEEAAREAEVAEAEAEAAQAFAEAAMLSPRNRNSSKMIRV